MAEAASVIQRMQKGLTEMNVQLGNVLSDLSGVSGMKIIEPSWKGSVIPGNWQAWSSLRSKPPRRISSRATDGPSRERPWRQKPALLDRVVRIKMDSAS